MAMEAVVSELLHHRARLHARLAAALPPRQLVAAGQHGTATSLCHRQREHSVSHQWPPVEAAAAATTTTCLTSAEVQQRQGWRACALR